MNFISFRFVAFIVITACIYFAFPKKKYQWVVLLAASWVFYLAAGVRYAFYLLFTSLTSYYAALRIDQALSESKAVLKANKETWDREQKKAQKETTARKTHRILALVLVLNFGVLFLLKYIPSILAASGNLFGFSGVTLRFVLPLGISFYTFQAMGYVIDVCRGDVRAERNFGKYTLFVSFFPQLLQGPISRYDQLAGQLFEEHRADFTRIKYGMELALWGLFKKMVIADHAIAAIRTVTEAPDAFTGTTLSFTVLLYALQVYADFSGGIDIARAVAQVLGIDMIQNFRQPYFATTLTDYWNRWHISLGAWMKNYIFYPIALSKTANRFTKTVKGSRFGRTKAGAHIAVVLPGTVASLIVFLIVGIWHGAGWRYILYGVWNGGVIMLSILLKPCFEWLNRLLHINTAAFTHRCFQTVRTFLLVCIGNITDLARGGRDCFEWIRRILLEQDFAAGREEIQNGLGLSPREHLLLLLSGLLLFAVGLIHERNPQSTIRGLLDERHFIIRWLLIFSAVAAILVFGAYGPGYSAAEFAYMQF